MVIRLTKSQVKKFWKNVEKWLTILTMADWEVTPNNEDECVDRDKTLADVACFPEHKSAAMTLYRDWQDTPVTQKNVDAVACHETLHILFSKLMELALEREVTKKQLDEAEHDIIRALVRAFTETHGK